MKGPGCLCVFRATASGRIIEPPMRTFLSSPSLRTGRLITRLSCNSIYRAIMPFLRCGSSNIPKEPSGESGPPLPNEHALRDQALNPSPTQEASERSVGQEECGPSSPVDYDTPTFLRRNIVLKGTGSGQGRVECQTKEMLPPELDVLEKLILPSEAKAVLQEAVILVTRGNRAKGHSPVFLFHGPPGTGKTYAAKIVACAMDIPLRTVGLHEVMSKYIGETEARTAALFQDASKRGAALFFDEADSFLWTRDFATRGWEATAVNCLLACLDGAKTPVFFATNHAGSLDSALDRRLTWKLAFPLPGPVERAAIWQLELKPWGLLRDNVDPAALAASVPLTGGLIRNAVERIARRLECGLASYETLQADLCFAARAETEKMNKCDRRKVGFGA